MGADRDRHRPVQLGISPLVTLSACFRNSAMSDHVKCPACDLPDQVEKVSAIYIAGIEQKRAPNTPQEQRVLIRAVEIKQNLAVLSQRLRPPAGEKKSLTRLLHPDMVVVVFSVILPVFLWGIWDSQRSMFMPLALILAALYVAYLWQRKAIVRRYESQKTRRQAADRRIAGAIERWLKLFYCARDDIVFYPGTEEQIPADEMLGHLLGDYPVK